MRTLSFICVTLFSMMQLSSEEMQHQQNEQPKYSSFYAGPQGQYARFKVDSLSTTFDGSMWGGDLGFNYKKPNSLYGHTSLKWLVGTTKSKGHGDRRLDERLIETRLGYVAKVCKMHFIPYIGYGFQFFKDKRESTSALDGFTFKYRNYYLPLGINWTYFFLENMNIGINFQWRYDIEPTVKFPFASFSGIKWTLRHKDGYYASLPFEYLFTKTWSLKLEPYWRRINFGSSKAQTSTGINLGLGEKTFDCWGAVLNCNAYF